MLFSVVYHWIVLVLYWLVRVNSWTHKSWTILVNTFSNFSPSFYGSIITFICRCSRIVRIIKKDLFQLGTSSAHLKLSSKKRPFFRAGLLVMSMDLLWHLRQHPIKMMSNFYMSISSDFRQDSILTLSISIQWFSCCFSSTKIYVNSMVKLKCSFLLHFCWNYSSPVFLAAVFLARLAFILIYKKPLARSIVIVFYWTSLTSIEFKVYVKCGSKAFWQEEMNLQL